ncbi:hypothetical protein THAOC_32183, partial [Thalassiosira oceanica]
MDRANAAGGGDKRPRLEVDGPFSEHAAGDPVDVAAALFDAGMSRVRNAELELASAASEMEAIRRRIRASGAREPDSLLRLGDGAGNHLLCRAISYLSHREVGKLETVCKPMKSITERYWKVADAELDETGRASSADGPRQRVVWHLLASEYALSISAMRCHFERHLVTNDDEYEAYVCISRRSDGGVVTKGFRSYEIDMCDYNFEYNRENFDFYTWPEVLEVNKIVESIEGGLEAEDAAYEAAERFERHLSDHMEDITVVVVAIHKVTSTVSLLAAQNNFGDRQRVSGDGGIDNMGHHGFCWPHGYMAAKSHGAFNEDTDSKVKLGILFDTRSKPSGPSFAMPVVLGDDDFQEGEYGHFGALPMICTVIALFVCEIALFAIVVTALLAYGNNAHAGGDTASARKDDGEEDTTHNEGAVEEAE